MTAAGSTVQRKVAYLAGDLGIDGHAVESNVFGGFDLHTAPYLIRIWVEDSEADVIRLEVFDAPTMTNVASASFSNMPEVVIRSAIDAWTQP